MTPGRATIRRGISRRDFLRTALTGAGALAAGPVFWKRPGWAQGIEPLGAHLAFGANPTTDMSVSWLTLADVANPVLDYGEDTSYGCSVQAETCGVPAATRGVAGSPPLYPASMSRYHHVRLVGLEPGKDYHYRVRHDGGASADRTFRTAPSATEAFRFTAFGDQGVSANAAATTARVQALAPAFHFHVGDLCYAHTIIGIGLAGPTNQMVWDQWFGMISPQAALAPWMPTVGNHEMEPGHGELGYDGYLARFALPENGASGAPVTYWFRYGNVAVIALDANDASYEIATNRDYTGGAQETWLGTTLAMLRCDPTIDFIVVGFHHCAYCTNVVHASDGGVRERWQGLFEQYGVDLVINGHNHCYERSRVNGITYITAGGGGQAAYQAALYPASYVSTAGGVRVPETAEWSAFRYLDISLLSVDVTAASQTTPAMMKLQGRKPDGEVIDEITLSRANPSPCELDLAAGA